MNNDTTRIQEAPKINYQCGTDSATILADDIVPGNFEVMARPGYFAYAIIHGDNMEVSVHDGLLS